VSDFRDRFGEQLAAAAAALAAAPEADFRARFGAQLAIAAGELAAGRRPLAAPAARPEPFRGRLRLPRLRGRSWVPGLAPADFRARFGLQLASAAADLARARRRVLPPRATRRLPWLTRPVAVGLTLTAFAGSAFAAVAIWTPLLGNPQYGYNPGAATSAPPADQLAALDVLRRPQSDADRGALSTAALTYINNYTKGVRTAYVRLLATIGSEAFVLVPVEQRDGTPVPGEVPTESAPLQNALCLYVADTSPVFTHVQCWSLANVLGGGANSTFNGQLFGLVPDGVSGVTVNSVAASPLSGRAADNFFAITLPAGSPPPLGYTLSFTRSGG
jgi:hypothetical protein